MLPKLLTEVLCSLTSNHDHVAFSVVWEMTEEAEIVKVDYFKSIIHPKMSLCYEDAQNMINDVNDKSDIT
jgi:exosome complex exonuclease DIS3/RRP44